MVLLSRAPGARTYTRVDVLPENTKPHTRDPKEVKLDPNDPKSKQTYIPKAQSFEEYMKSRGAKK